MKYLVLILAVLIAIPAFALAGEDEQYLDLTDGSKATFKLANENKTFPSMSISRMGGYFTVKYKKSAFCGLSYKAKSTKDVFNLNDWQSVSVDVRVKKQEAIDPLIVAVIFYPIQEGSVERWNFTVPRNSLPVGKWCRVLIPIQILTQVPSKKNPQGNVLSNVSLVDIGCWSDIEVSSTIETDLRNVRLWKTPVDEVKVLPLEK